MFVNHSTTETMWQSHAVLIYITAITAAAILTTCNAANSTPITTTAFTSATANIAPITTFRMETKYPCAFIDTVNISGSYTHHTINMSYIHEWKIIPRELVAVYDFVILNGIRVPVERHLRACVCKLKPCIRFCCTQGHYYDVQNRTCSSNIPPTIIDQQSMQVMQTNGSSKIVPTTRHFSVHIGAPCERMHFITKYNHYVNWTLYENGTIAHKNHLFSKHYCYTPLQQMDNATWEWQPLACAPEKLPFILGVREWTYAICLIIAVICMIIIFFIYLLCNELRRTFYGVAIKAYSLCIVIGYSLLAHLTLTDPVVMSKFACGNIPSFVVLYLVLSFYLLSFISFNFYLNFHGVILTKLMFWLIFFPIVLLTVGWSFFVGHDYYGGKPVFGGGTCWFDPRNWSIMIYFNAPICVACAICGFFYILTLIRISERRDSDVNQLTAGIDENRFKSFWLFFGYTIIVWMVGVSSFAFNYYRAEPTHINYVVCVFTALHGFGALYALLGRNKQIQNCMGRIDADIDDDNDDEN